MRYRVIFLALIWSEWAFGSWSKCCEREDGLEEGGPFYSNFSDRKMGWRFEWTGVGSWVSFPFVLNVEKMTSGGKKSLAIKSTSLPPGATLAAKRSLISKVIYHRWKVNYTPWTITDLKACQWKKKLPRGDNLLIFFSFFFLFSNSLTKSD